MQMCMEVELVSAEIDGNELQRCGPMLGVSGEPPAPCLALHWPARDILAVICDLRGVRMQEERSSGIWGWVGRWVGKQGWC